MEGSERRRGSDGVRSESLWSPKALESIAGRGRCPEGRDAGPRQGANPAIRPYVFGAYNRRYTKRRAGARLQVRADDEGRRRAPARLHITGPRARAYHSPLRSRRIRGPRSANSVWIQVRSARILRRSATSSGDGSGSPRFLRSSTRSKLAQAAPANNPQQSWGFEGEPPEAVIKDSGTRVGTS